MKHSNYKFLLDRFLAFQFIIWSTYTKPPKYSLDTLFTEPPKYLLDTLFTEPPKYLFDTLFWITLKDCIFWKLKTKIMFNERHRAASETLDVYVTFFLH